MSTQKLLIEPLNKLVREIYNFFYSLSRNYYNSKFSKRLFNNLQKFFIVFLYYKSGKSIRNFLNDFEYNILTKTLQLKKIPSKLTLHNWLKEYNIEIIRNLVQKSLISKNFVVLAIDGTGLDSLNTSPYYQKRVGVNRKFKEIYNKRNLIESVFGSLKRRFKIKIISKDF